MIVDFFFYLFAAVLLLSAILVVGSRNPVHSVLFLILAFFNAAALFLIAGAEFLAMILVIVYVGAVAVLFLFVVMMLDVDFSALKEGFTRYLPLGGLVAGVLVIEMVVVYVGAVAVLFLFVVMMLDVDFTALRQGFARYLPIGGVVAGVLTVEMVIVAVSVANKGAAAGSTGPAPIAGGVTNAEAIGRVLYTDYVYFFQAAGMILLVAMIGAIVLTLKHRPNIRRQIIADQVARTPATGRRMVDIKPGEGIS